MPLDRALHTSNYDYWACSRLSRGDGEIWACLRIIPCHCIFVVGDNSHRGETSAKRCEDERMLTSSLPRTSRDLAYPSRSPGCKAGSHLVQRYIADFSQPVD